LFMVLIMVLVISLLGASLLWMSFSTYNDAIRTTSKMKARTAADAGHNIAYFRLKKMLSEAGTQLPQQNSPASLPASDQTYTFSITTAADGGYDILSKGYCKNIVRNIRSRAYRTGGTTPYGLCVSRDIYFHGGTIDAYDSSKGPYGVGNKGLPLAFRTNGYQSGSFYMGQLASTPAGGQLIVGPEAAANPSIVKTGQGVFNGTITAADKPFEFPPVPFSTSGLVNKGDLSSGTVTAGTHLYNRIAINQQTVTIKGHVTLYVTQSSYITQGALQITNDGNSSLTLYINGNQFMITQGNMNSVTQKPKLLKIYATDNCTMVKFDQNPNFYGMIYAPNAELQLNIGNLNGAFMGRRAYVDQATIHYDIDLINESMFQSSGSDLTSKLWIEY